MTGERFVTVFRGASLMQAEMVKGLLVGKGIAARIPGELASDPFTTTQETLGGVTVEVPEEEATQARQAIREASEEGRELQEWLQDHPGEDME